MESNISEVLAKLVDVFKIPLTQQTIYEEVTKHPCYPSMLTISEVLDKWKIPNGAYQLTIEELSEIEGPFIAHLNKDGGEFILVTAINDETITVTNERWSNHQLKLDTFKRLFSGTVLLTEPEADSGEPNYKNKLFLQRLSSLRVPFILITLIGFMISRVFFQELAVSEISFALIALVAVKTCGLAVATLLLIQSVDRKNKLVNSVCKTTPKTDCSSLLSSDAAKITSYLSWSEVGFFYFAGSWLLLLFSNHSASLLSMLALINLISLPYTFYSIYYQFKIAKRWCVLCCLIQASLWFEFLTFLPILSHPFVLINFSELSYSILAFSFPVALWIFIKPLLIKAAELEPVKLQLNRFKYNSEFFWKTLEQQPKYAVLSDSKTVILGNPETANIITMVSNPYCKPCSAAYVQLEKMLEENANLKVQILYLVSDIPGGVKITMAKHLIVLSFENPSNFRKGLMDWYSQKYTYEKWAAMYPVSNLEADQYMDQYRSWCNLAEINATPTILVNGSKLPESYQLEDLKYFL